MADFQRLTSDLEDYSSFDSDDIHAKMKKAYLECPKAIKFLQSLGVSEEVIDQNIAKVYDLVCDFNYCANCPGIDKCHKENPLLITKLTYYHGFLERELTPCKKVLEKALIEEQYRIVDFDNNLLEANLKKVDMTPGKRQALALYAKYLNDESDAWLFLSGDSNTGRSYFAAAIANDLAKKKKGPICFINSALRFKELVDFSYKEKDRFQKRLELYSTCPVLFIDDFGSEFKTDFVRDAILLQILTRRAAKKLLTIITSDYSIKEIVTMYSTNKAAGVQANRIGKILKSECKKEIVVNTIPYL